MDRTVVAFVVVRLSSSRLSKKQLRKIGDKRIIDWVIESVKKSSYIDKIVITTTKETENMPLIDVAKEHDVDVFLYSGDEDDVVGRLAKAADVYKADIPVLISGDCPLIWAGSLDKLIKRALENGADKVSFCLKNGKPTIHEGMGVFSKKCWELADKISGKPNLREHQFPVVDMNPGLFEMDCIFDDEVFYRLKHRVSVDTLADLEFMRKVYDELRKRGEEFNMPNFIKLAEEKPEILRINKDVHQMRISEKQRKALFILKSGSNLELFLGMAYGLTKKGVGVRFFAEDESLREAVKDKGFGLVYNQDPSKFDFVCEEKW